MQAKRKAKSNVKHLQVTLQRKLKIRVFDYEKQIHSGNGQYKLRVDGKFNNSNNEEPYRFVVEESSG